MRKVNAERVFTLLKSVIICELERNGSENNLLFIIKSLVATNNFATFSTANRNSTCFAVCLSNNSEGIRALRHQIRNLNNA